MPIPATIHPVALHPIGRMAACLSCGSATVSSWLRRLCPNSIARIRKSVMDCSEDTRHNRFAQLSLVYRVRCETVIVSLGHIALTVCHFPLTQKSCDRAVAIIGLWSGLT